MTQWRELTIWTGEAMLNVRSLALVVVVDVVVQLTIQYLGQGMGGRNQAVLVVQRQRKSRCIWPGRKVRNKWIREQRIAH